MSGHRREDNAEIRMQRVERLINNSPVTLNVADVAKAVGVSKPQAANDVDKLLKQGRLDRFKIRRGWKPEEIIRRIKF